MLNKLANLVASVKNWGDLDNRNLDHKIPADEDGWVKIGAGEVNVVSEIKKVKGLKYKQIIEGDYNRHYFVVVTDEVGELIELYIKTGDYAGLDLSEFLAKSLDM